jgi:hypothetical protein
MTEDEKAATLVSAVMESVARGENATPRTISRQCGMARKHIEYTIDLLLIKGWIRAHAGRYTITPANQRQPLTDGLKALSAECKENPFVSRWHTMVNAGAPGMGAA